MTSNISITDLKAFADKKINLKMEEVSAGRDRVRFLRKRLADHIANNPGFSLVKMLHAGSVVKGTALADLKRHGRCGLRRA